VDRERPRDGDEVSETTVTKLVVIFGFLMAFVAGLIVGVNRPQQVVVGPSAPGGAGGGGGPTSRPSRESELDTLLNLRPEQKAKLKEIWSEVADKGRKHHDHRRDELRDQRDRNVQSLLTAEQKSRFEQVHKDYDDQRKALEREMRASFQKAVEDTKALLDPDQRAKYEQWLEKRQWGRGPRGGPGGDRGPGGGDRGGDRGPGGGGGGTHRDHETTRKSDAGATSKSSGQP
jgi:Spy/CpxP family protein refolding chaperone